MNTIVILSGWLIALLANIISFTERFDKSKKTHPADFSLKYWVVDNATFFIRALLVYLILMNIATISYKLETVREFLLNIFKVPTMPFELFFLLSSVLIGMTGYSLLKLWAKRGRDKFEKIIE
jgi:amino acid permease